MGKQQVDRSDARKEHATLQRRHLEQGKDRVMLQARLLAPTDKTGVSEEALRLKPDEEQEEQLLEVVYSAQPQTLHTVAQR